MKKSKKIGLEEFKEDKYWDDRNYDHALVAVLASFFGIVLAICLITYLMSL
tara:strand:+ start:8486 stop:8638 length:153 start_codon:yes stop_codon:yes gene_type:complete